MGPRLRGDVERVLGERLNSHGCLTGEYGGLDSGADCAWTATSVVAAAASAVERMPRECVSRTRRSTSEAEWCAAPRAGHARGNQLRRMG